LFNSIFKEEEEEEKEEADVIISKNRQRLTRRISNCNFFV
jgi:hypothetical protein